MGILSLPAFVGRLFLRISCSKIDYEFFEISLNDYPLLIFREDYPQFLPRRLLREAASSVPHKRTHKARSYACSFSFTRKLRELKVAE
jgi:hypothetical protein